MGRIAGFVLLTIAAGVGGGYLLLPLAVHAFVRGLAFTLNGCIWLAASFSRGTDTWTIASTVGRAAGSMLLQTRGLTVFGALIVLGAAALYGLQRLLGSEGEWSQ